MDRNVYYNAQKLDRKINELTSDIEKLEGISLVHQYSKNVFNVVLGDKYAIMVSGEEIASIAKLLADNRKKKLDIFNEEFRRL